MGKPVKRSNVNVTLPANVIEARDMLVLKIQNTAHWRSTQAVEFPDDERNMSAASALAALAERLMRLPADNKELERYAVTLERIARADSGWLERAVDAESQFLRDYGFSRHEEMDPREFLDALLIEVAGARHG